MVELKLAFLSVWDVYIVALGLIYNVIHNAYVMYTLYLSENDYMYNIYDIN